MVSEQINGVNGALKTGPDAHFDYFKQWYDYVNDYTIVRKAKETYDSAKHSMPLVEDTLTRVENGVHSGITDVAAPLYANYCYPTTDRLVDMYSKGKDTTKVAVDKTMSVAAHTGALSLGLAIVTAQMGLIATTSATNLVLSSLIYTKNAGISAVQTAHAAEKAVEARLREALDQSLQLAKIPADKVAEYTNTFLDIANAVFDRLLSLPEVKESPDSSVADRFRFISSKVSNGLSKRAHEGVIDPVRHQVHSVVERMNQKLVLAEYVQKHKEWVSEKFGNMSSDLLELKSKIEGEATKYNISPEEVLVRSIRRTSQKLNDNFNQLRAHGTELVGETAATKIEAATSYVQQLDSNLGKAESLYQIRDEVLEEARVKFGEMAQWTASLWVGDSNGPDKSTVQ